MRPRTGALSGGDPLVPRRLMRTVPTCAAVVVCCVILVAGLALLAFFIAMVAAFSQTGSNK